MIGGIVAEEDLIMSSIILEVHTISYTVPDVCVSLKRYILDLREEGLAVGVCQCTASRDAEAVSSITPVRNFIPCRVCRYHRSA